MKKLSSVVAIILAFVGCARAADISSSPRANNDKTIDVSIHGEITVNDYQRFHDAVQAIDETKTVLVKLDSPGGLIFPGIEIGNLIHLRGWTTWVPEKTVCGSTCARSGSLELIVGQRILRSLGFTLPTTSNPCKKTVKAMLFSEATTPGWDCVMRPSPT